MARNFSNHPKGASSND
jgi:hypothetical protein